MLMILPWPGVRGTYRDCYRFAASLVYSRLGNGASVRYELPTAKDRAKNTADDEQGGLIVTLERRREFWGNERQSDGTLKRKSGVDLAVFRTAIPTGRVGFVPWAELIALVLASPVTWSRKWRALLWGSLCVNVFVTARFGMYLYYEFTTQPAMRLSEHGALWGKVEIGRASCRERV